MQINEILIGGGGAALILLLTTAITDNMNFGLYVG